MWKKTDPQLVIQTHDKSFFSKRIFDEGKYYYPMSNCIRDTQSINDTISNLDKDLMNI